MRRGSLAIALALVASLLLAGCGSASPKAASPTTTSPTDPRSPYERAVDAAAERHLQVWLEADLAKRWLQGRASFDEGVRRLAALGARPGVVGFKIADELGYHPGYDGHPERVRAFLADASQALRRAAPGRLLLVDVVVPELGCAPGVPSVAAAAADCRAKARAAHPALTLEELDGLFRERFIDVVDVSTGLLEEPTYRSWGITRDQAQEAAWREVNRRGWSQWVRLQGRKALAHPGPYAAPPAQAEADVHTFVDLPMAAGAQAVDVWTWRQTYQGEVVRLIDPGLAPNPLWQALRARHQRGDVLITHFTPSSVERNLDTDLDTLAQGFSAVFVAAGIG